jgi:adenylylsulfate kinase
MQYVPSDPFPYLCITNTIIMPAGKNNKKWNELWFENRRSKEKMLKQNAKVIWMCGLPCAGKSTLAECLDKELSTRGYLSQVIDGDMIRSGLNKGLGYDEDDRYENLRRVAEVAKLFTGCGVIVIIAFISPTAKMRQMAKDIVGKHDFIEVFVNAPVKICEARDTKGHYKQAREGSLKNFTGIDSPFEPPAHPDIEINTEINSVKKCIQQLIDHILPLVCTQIES